jgi:hypothetical protein
MAGLSISSGKPHKLHYVKRPAFYRRRSLVRIPVSPRAVSFLGRFGPGAPPGNDRTLRAETAGVDVHRTFVVEAGICRAFGTPLWLSAEQFAYSGVRSVRFAEINEFVLQLFAHLPVGVHAAHP